MRAAGAARFGNLLALWSLFHRSLSFRHGLVRSSNFFPLLAFRPFLTHSAGLAGCMMLDIILRRRKSGRAHIDCRNNNHRYFRQRLSPLRCGGSMCPLQLRSDIVFSASACPVTLTTTVRYHCGKFLDEGDASKAPDLPLNFHFASRRRRSNWIAPRFVDASFPRTEARRHSWAKAISATISRVTQCVRPPSEAIRLRGAIQSARPRCHQPASHDVHGQIASILAAMEAAAILEKGFEALRRDYLEKLEVVREN